MISIICLTMVFLKRFKIATVVFWFSILCFHFDRFSIFWFSILCFSGFQFTDRLITFSKPSHFVCVSRCASCRLSVVNSMSTQEFNEVTMLRIRCVKCVESIPKLSMVSDQTNYRINGVHSIIVCIVIIIIIIQFISMVISIPITSPLFNVCISIFRLKRSHFRAGFFGETSALGQHTEGGAVWGTEYHGVLGCVDYLKYVVGTALIAWSLFIWGWVKTLSPW